MPRPVKKTKTSQGNQPFSVHFEPLSASQRKVLDFYSKNDVVFAIGPAGCGKTMSAIGAAMLDIFHSTTEKHLLILRPAVETGRSLGFLPGTLDEKILPYMGSFSQALRKVAYNVPPDLVKYEALGFQRGMSYEDSVVILDEAQNATFAQLQMFLTRLGKNSKLLVLGDPDQTDIKPSIPDYDVDLDAVVDSLSRMPGIGIVEFGKTESLRHPLVAKMLKRLNATKNPPVEAPPSYGKSA